ncbi:MAG: PAS domain-containing sensor histidine kinase, partial [bacterium]|nr:PAS domain-containing sensor histidine kinase [Candidatus Kapabacteria bacterium]
MSDAVPDIERLRARAAQYKRIVESANDGILMTDADGNAMFVNQPLESTLGFTVEEILRERIFDVEELRMRAAVTSDSVMRSAGVAEQFDARFQCKDGSWRWLLVSVTPLSNPDGTPDGTIIRMTDITRHKQTEEALRLANDMLEQRVSERTSELAATMRQLELANLGQQRFIADASHDIRTPLTVVRAELDLLLSSGSHDDRTRQALLRAASEARRLDVLTSDLLTLATVNDVESVREAARLDEILLDSIASFTAVAREKHIAWNIDISEAVE